MYNSLRYDVSLLISRCWFDFPVTRFQMFLRSSYRVMRVESIQVVRGMLNITRFDVVRMVTMPPIYERLDP